MIEINAQLGSDVALMDATVEISPTNSVKRHLTGHNGLMTESIFAPVGSRLEFRFNATVHLLVLYDEGARGDGETSVDGSAPSKLRNFANKMTFVPAGHTYYERHEISTSMRVSALYLNPTNLKRPPDSEAIYVPRILFEDPVLWKTAAKLKSVIEIGKTRGIHYSEALTQVLMHELPQSDQHPTFNPPPCRGGLAIWQMCAVTAYLEQHLIPLP